MSRRRRTRTGTGEGRTCRFPRRYVTANRAAAVIAIECASAEAEVAAISAKMIAAQKKQAAALENVLASIVLLQAVRRRAAVVRFAETTALERDRSGWD